MNEQWSSAFERVPALLAAHIQISFAALALGLALSLPLVIWAHRRPAVQRVLLGVASFIQTIPSLALLALFFPLLVGLSTLVGPWLRPLGFLPALLALTLYALLPIMRNALTGLAAVDPAALTAADGIGMTAMQRLRLVEAPLALPTIIAGIRTAAVWTIGAATLASTVGQPSLGDLIFAGLQTQSWPLVLAGCAAAAALALTVDAAIGLAQWSFEHRWPVTAWVSAGIVAAVMLASLVPLVTPLFAGDGERRESITIGAKGFSEQFILARLIGGRLEAAGYRVNFRDGLGSGIAFGALSNGDVDIIVDYSGTLWTNQLHRTDTVSHEQMVAELRAWTAQETGARVVGPLGFENAYAFAVRPETAARDNLRTLADLARVAPRLTLGTDPEFLERPEWASVRRAYGMQFGNTRSLNPSFMYDALAGRQADVITAYTSDGRVAADGLVILSDPRQAIPGYDALLMVNQARTRDARLMAVLRGLIGRVRVEDMRTANYQVDRATDKQTPEQAATWLEGRVR